MQSASSIPPLRDVVLVGGGHSHVQVLKAFGMRPEPGVRLTLVTPTLQTPYSGMLPGCISGIYAADDIHIRLQPLCRFANARLIHAPATGIDVEAQQVLLSGRPPIRYDWLSLNCGAVPVAPHADAVTAKPISDLLPKWREIVDVMHPGDPLIVVGAGAAGVELAMAARAVLPAACSITVVGETLLDGHGESARNHIQEHLQRLDITWVRDRVSSESAGQVNLQSGDALSAAFVLWVTQAEAPRWLADTGLSLDEAGFIRVDECLRSVSHPRIFAAGDVAHLTGQQRPKSGVYAVRAGPVLADNLRRAARGRDLRHYHAQRQHLAIISTGDGYAVASRGKWAFSGRLWWVLKDQIDRNFMRKFNELPEISDNRVRLPEALAEALPVQSERCGGCGAKIAADPLRRVLQRLPAQPAARVELGIGDDAAQVRTGTGSMLLTVDGFRAMLDDPYLFGRIAAHHSLNDILAMAAQPTAALAFITIPLMADALMEEELYQVMRGVTDVLNAHDVPLVGGHSAEGAELGVGLTVVGEPGTVVLRKGGAQSGDRLLLTKPIGTGVALAAAMQGSSGDDTFASAVRCMDSSNAAALRVLLDAQAHALTDITGFGLAGHLSELLRASGGGVRLDLQAVPVLPGVLALMSTVHSSLQSSNETALQDFACSPGYAADDVRLRLLADPQTSGGLLAAVPRDHAAACLGRLIDGGYQAAVIGEVTADQRWLIE